jgi:hypothetical protein
MRLCSVTPSPAGIATCSTGYPGLGKKPDEQKKQRLFNPPRGFDTGPQPTRPSNLAWEWTLGSDGVEKTPLDATAR